MKSLFNKTDFEECLNRIDNLDVDSKPLWGKMSSGQMFAHCSEIQEVSNGKELKNTPFMVKVFKGFIRKMVVNDKLYKKETPTHPQYRQTSPKDFKESKDRLLKALNEFVDKSEEETLKIKHPLFGAMTLEEKGWAMYKHLDHHLMQFGV